MHKKYHILTYGCQMNVHESEKLAGVLEKFSLESVDKQEEADVIVLNTCCIRETAESHILGNLGYIKKLKEKKPSLIVAVCGCMTQQDGTAKRLKERCPFVNIIFGTHNFHEFSNYLNLAFNGQNTLEVWEEEMQINEDSPISRTSGLNAWVNIMYGCNNFCTYCIVPYVRGRERSREFALIVDDVKKLVEDGYKEITLLGQNVNSYGSDLRDSNVTFAKLLETLANINGKFRIKFMTSHPKDISKDVIKIIAKYDNIAKYIHLPVQAGSNKILELMNRKYTREDYFSKIDLIRKYIPNVGLSSDIMVGFVQEDDNDFMQTVDLVERVKYNNLFTFIYSRRSGTKADTMDGHIDKKIKKERIQKLIDIQFNIANSLAKECIGKTYEVLCNDYSNGVQTGITSCNKLIYFKSEENLYSQFVKVKVIDSKNSNLNGELIKE